MNGWDDLADTLAEESYQYKRKFESEREFLYAQFHRGKSIPEKYKFIDICVTEFEAECPKYERNLLQRILNLKKEYKFDKENQKEYLIRMWKWPLSVKKEDDKLYLFKNKVVHEFKIESIEDYTFWRRSEGTDPFLNDGYYCFKDSCQVKYIGWQNYDDFDSEDFSTHYWAQGELVFDDNPKPLYQQERIKSRNRIAPFIPGKTKLSSL
jgi:hypothetical protein